MTLLAARRFARTPLHVSPRAALVFALIATAIAALGSASAQAAPMTFTVNSTADPGTGTCDVAECTLREAMNNANTNPGVDTIAFDLDTTAEFPPHVIEPASALPNVTEGVTIDGTTQPDYSHEPAVEIDGTNAGAGTGGLSIGASSTVKALGIGGFSGSGIALTGGTSTLLGNWIGVTAANTGAGIAVGALAPNNVIGGTGPDDSNTIATNDGVGIAISSSGNTMQGNSIGSNGGGGVSVTAGSNNVIGGTADGAANTIQGNAGAGVAIAAGTGNDARGNSIDFNDELGIDLGTTGVTPNDHLDPDTGANNLQNFPVLTNVSNNSGAGTTTVTGTLDSIASATYHVEIFSSFDCDPSNNGEGSEPVAAQDVTTNASGSAAINATFATPDGNIYTATATSTTGNTSEFSACFTAPPRLTVDKAGNGTGTVTSTPAGINCGATCAADFTMNTMVTLHGAPDAGMTFAGWSGGVCTGTADCVVTMDSSQSVTATFTDPTFPLHLAQAIASDTSVITGATLTAPPSGTPNAIRTAPLKGYPTNGGSYGIMTSGDATLADQPDAGASADDGGPNVRGNSDFDVSILKIDLNVPSGANCLTFDFRFFSTEYPTYVGSSFNDAFIAELDTSDWTTAGSVITANHNFAFDPSHDVISINSTGATAMSAANATGTGYGGGTDPLHASSVITSGAHSLYLSIFDQGDHVLDTAVLLDNLRLSTRDAAACASGASSDNTAPTVTLTTPANGSSSADTTPTYSGAAGTAPGDLDQITVKIYAGNAATGTPVQTLTTNKTAGTWTVDGTTALAPGTYTAQAEQSDSSGNTGFSSANTFTITGTARTLTVSKAGAGTGTVTSTPGAINCGATCTDNYANGVSVTLHAAPDSDSTFTGWSGACTGTGDCVLSMTADKTVTATFTTIPPKHTLTVSKTGTGSGSVASAPGGIDCGATCSAQYDQGTGVTLTATPAAGSTFTGWSGDCSGTGTCTLTMGADHSATATFTATITPPVKRTLTVSKAGTGSGSVSSAPAGISCGATCSAQYDNGTGVTLTATPAAGSTFTGWSGDCSGTGTCTLTMGADHAATATFTTNVVLPPPGGPPGVDVDDLFCGAQHRGRCNGLKVKGIFDRPGNASWTFDAYNPNPGGKSATAATKKIRLGQIKRVITKAGTVQVVFKLKKGAKTTRLFKQVKKAKLKSILVTLTFTTAGGEKKTSTKTIKLKG
jgi:CSLREA domain-containing protein